MFAKNVYIRYYYSLIYKIELSLNIDMLLIVILLFI